MCLPFVFKSKANEPHSIFTVRLSCYISKTTGRREVRKKANADDAEIKTPFAKKEVRSASCTKKQREVIGR